MYSLFKSKRFWLAGILPVLFYCLLIGLQTVHGLEQTNYVHQEPAAVSDQQPIKRGPSLFGPLAMPLPLLKSKPFIYHPPKPKKPALADILMYHYIRAGVDPKKDGLGYRLSITSETLDQQLAYLQAQGYHFLTMNQLMTSPIPDKTVVLTFDDGYEDFYTAALPILKKYNATATAYIIAGKIGGPYMTWDQLKEAQAAGIEIGAHTMNHYDLQKLPVDEQRYEIDQSKKVLEQQLGVPVVSFCYPSGRYNADTIKIVQQSGFTSATTTNSGGVYSLKDPFVLPRVRVAPGVDLTKEL